MTKNNSLFQPELFIEHPEKNMEEVAARFSGALSELNDPADPWLAVAHLSIRAHEELKQVLGKKKSKAIKVENVMAVTAACLLPHLTKAANVESLSGLTLIFADTILDERLAADAFLRLFNEEAPELLDPILDARGVWDEADMLDLLVD